MKKVELYIYIGKSYVAMNDEKIQWKRLQVKSGVEEISDLFLAPKIEVYASF